MTKMLLLAAAFLIIFGAKALSDMQAFRGSPLKVQAEVTGVSDPTKEMRVPREGRVGVRYTHNGEILKHSITAHDKFWSALKPGDTVELVLNPKDPSQFIPASKLSQSGAFGYALIGAGLLLIAVSFFKR